MSRIRQDTPDLFKASSITFSGKLLEIRSEGINCCGKYFQKKYQQQCHRYVHILKQNISTLQFCFCTIEECSVTLQMKACRLQSRSQPSTRTCKIPFASLSSTKICVIQLDQSCSWSSRFFLPSLFWPLFCCIILQKQIEIEKREFLFNSLSANIKLRNRVAQIGSYWKFV